jgi:hypothetical protein
MLEPLVETVRICLDRPKSNKPTKKLSIGFKLYFTFFIVLTLVISYFLYISQGSFQSCVFTMVMTCFIYFFYLFIKSL